jgi:hypothetical protein
MLRALQIILAHAALVSSNFLRPLVLQLGPAGLKEKVPNEQPYQQRRKPLE